MGYFFLDSAILICLLVSFSVFLPHHSIAFRTDTSFISNTFTVDTITEEIYGKLSEPSFDPKLAGKLLPGSVIPKDPQIENTSVSDTGIYAAMRLEFHYTDACPYDEKAGLLLEPEDMESLCRAVDIDYEADQAGGHWIRFEGESSGDPIQHFYYQNRLDRRLPERGEATVPVMTTIKAAPEKKNSDLSRIQMLGGFTIKVFGYVVPHASEKIDDHAVSAQDAYTRGLFDPVM